MYNECKTVESEKIRWAKLISNLHTNEILKDFQTQVNKKLSHVMKCMEEFVKKNKRFIERKETINLLFSIHSIHPF